MASEGIRLILCLGNPGPRYTMTWHNAGFWVADILARRSGVSFRNAGLFHAAVLPRGIHLAKPVTYMNESGRAAGALLNARGLEPSQMLVVCDDANLPLGTLRIRPEGSSGGQKGLQNILEVLGTQEFPRLRLGVGPVPERVPLSDYVLSRVPAPLEEEASGMAHRAADCVITALKQGLSEAQALYNAKPREEGTPPGVLP